jgi:hypothetical protein
MPGPGKTVDAFQADTASCKSFAAHQIQGRAETPDQRAAGTVPATGDGLTGDAGGAAAAGDGGGGGGGGALIGASSGANDQQPIQQHYDIVFSQCMYAKGEQVPGFAPVVAATPVALPDPAVRASQTELRRLGYLQGPADGYAGSRTRAAISGFEQANGLPVDGAVSSRLLARLRSTPANARARGAPANWVAPVGSSSASALGGWVAPASTSVSAVVSGPSGWVAPVKTH